MAQDTPITMADPWRELSRYTPARIAQGRAGMSQTTRNHLDFQLAHALARDAVHIPLDFADLAARLAALGYPSLKLQSRAEQHAHYLQRPDLGRLLSAAALQCLRNNAPIHADVAVVIADGLSSTAIDRHAVPLLRLLLPALQAAGHTLAPLTLVQYGRVAVGDVVAEHYAARFCIVLIGERPGLSSADSMGIYFTYQARSGVSTDADRNCISNIHGNGLSYQQALKKLLFLLAEAERLNLSGVNLKDQTVDAESELRLPQRNFLLD